MRCSWGVRIVLSVAACSGALVLTSALASALSFAPGPAPSRHGAMSALFQTAQQAEQAPAVVVQPGAPGKPTRTLPSTTKGNLPPASPADVLFMQGMIMHHAQAVEMTALIE